MIPTIYYNCAPTPAIINDPYTNNYHLLLVSTTVK